MIETDRLIIRLTSLNDVDDIHEILSDSQTMTYFVEGTYDKEIVKKFIEENQSKQIHYSVFIKDTNVLVGKLSFNEWFMKDTYEIGWIFNKKYTGNGYCTESAKAMINHGFKIMNLHRIIATCQPENIASNKVCLNLGMRKEGTFKQSIFYKDNIWWDESHYGILREEYLNESNRVKSKT